MNWILIYWMVTMNGLTTSNVEFPSEISCMDALSKLKSKSVFARDINGICVKRYK